MTAITTPDPSRPPDWEPTTRRPGAGILLGVVTVVLFLGALAIRSNLVFGFVLLALIFVPMERIWSLHRQKVLRTGWRTDLVHFAVNNLLTTVGLVAVVVLVGGILHAVVPEAVRGGITAQPFWLQTVEAFALAEVLQYWAHRASHTVPVLWRFHKLHHSITELDWVAAARLHPVDQAFARSCIVIPLFVLGFTRGTFGALLIVFTLQALFIHANVRFTFGPLRYVLATPRVPPLAPRRRPAGVQLELRGRAAGHRQALRDAPPRAIGCRGPLARELRDRRPGAGGLPRPDGLAVPVPLLTRTTRPLGRVGARAGVALAAAQAGRVIARVGLVRKVPDQSAAPPTKFMQDLVPLLHLSSPPFASHCSIIRTP